MPTIPDRFADYERPCGAQLDEKMTKTIEPGDHPNAPDEPQEVETFKHCQETLTFAEHYQGMRHVEGYGAKVHALRCPTCGEVHGVCPVCTDEEGAPGWYRGESTGEMLACHVCNQQEYARQLQEPW